MEPEPTAIEAHPLTPARWPDAETVFNGRGCSMARGCWCMCYRQTGPAPSPPQGMSHRDARRSELRALTDSGPPPGLIGYCNGAPVGWICLGPREHFARLRRSPVMKPVDAAPVWSIICFVVPTPHRGKGVARALLRRGIEYAREQGATMLEAYPVDRSGRRRDDSIWFGVKSMYDAAGFVEVARRKPERPVMRLRLRE